MWIPQKKNIWNTSPFSDTSKRLGGCLDLQQNMEKVIRSSQGNSLQNHGNWTSCLPRTSSNHEKWPSSNPRIIFVTYSSIVYSIIVLYKLHNFLLTNEGELFASSNSAISTPERSNLFYWFSYRKTEVKENPMVIHPDPIPNPPKKSCCKVGPAIIHHMGPCEIGAYNYNYKSIIYTNEIMWKIITIIMFHHQSLNQSSDVPYDFPKNFPKIPIIKIPHGNDSTFSNKFPQKIPPTSPLRRLLRQAPQRRRGEDVAGRLHEPGTVLLTRRAPGVADEDALGGLGTWDGETQLPKSPKRRFQGSKATLGSVVSDGLRYGLRF